MILNIHDDLNLTEHDEGKIMEGKKCPSSPWNVWELKTEIWNKNVQIKFDFAF